MLALLRGFAIGAAQSQARRRRCAQPRRGYGLEELWGLMADGSPLGDERRRASAEAALGEILTRSTARRTAAAYLQRCLRQLEAGTSVPQCRPQRGGSSPPPVEAAAQDARARRLASALEAIAGRPQPAKAVEVARPREVQ